jgi:hypothetical protein
VEQPTGRLVGRLAFATESLRHGEKSQNDYSEERRDEESAFLASSHALAYFQET